VYEFEKYLKTGSGIAFKATENNSNPSLTALTLRSLGEGGVFISICGVV
jgi:hypothetical protein